MVGGTVIGVVLRNDNTTRLVVQGIGHDRHIERIRTVRGHHGIKPGDFVWWQCRKIMWTPEGNDASGDQQGSKWDIVLEMIP